MKTLDALCESIARHAPKPAPAPAASEKLAPANKNGLSDEIVEQIAKRVVDILSAQTSGDLGEPDDTDTTNEHAANEGDTSGANNADEVDESDNNTP